MSFELDEKKGSPLITASILHFLNIYKLINRQDYWKCTEEKRLNRIYAKLLKTYRDELQWSGNQPSSFNKIKIKTVTQTPLTF